MRLVVGLGNPGPEYQENRHNLGFKVVDELQARARGNTPRAKFGAELSEVTIAGERVLLCKPMEYMNVSGQVVARVAGFWKVPVSDVVGKVAVLLWPSDRFHVLHRPADFADVPAS